MNYSFQEILNLIRENIRKFEPKAKIILFGSRARGDAREDSDWDVLTILDRENISREESKRIGYDLWLKGQDLGIEINNLLYTEKQWNENMSMLKFHIQEEGIAL